MNEYKWKYGDLHMTVEMKMNVTDIADREKAKSLFGVAGREVCLSAQRTKYERSFLICLM